MPSERENLNVQWTQDEIEALVRLRREGMEYPEIARRIGKSHDACRFKYNREEAKKGKEPYDAGRIDTISGDEWVIHLPRTPIKSEEDLIRECGIDTTLYEVVKLEVSSWSGTSKLKRGDKERFVVTPLYRVKAYLRKRSGGDVAKALTQLFDGFAGPSYEPVVRDGNGDHLAIIPLPDHHFGKYCWSQEVGASYDLDIAERLWRDAGASLLKRVEPYGLDHIVLVCGNDLSNSDNPQGSTTRGTAQDNDGRVQKVVQTIARSFVWLIEEARKIAPVKVMTVPGNHDQLVSYMIAMFLSAWFRDCEDVEVDVSPAMSKAIEFGKNFIWLAHGDGIPLKDVPLTMATDHPQLFGRTRFWEALTGHLHHEASKDYKGVVVRTCKALCAPDAWHKKHGYASRRGADAFVYHRTLGPCGHLTYNVDTET